MSTHTEKQAKWSDMEYQSGSRDASSDEVVRYVAEWRLRKCFDKITQSEGSLDKEISILVLCGGDGLEGSTLMDMGFTNVTVSDISQNGVDAALERDPRLRGVVLNAEATELDSNSFDITLVQDGLHHLSQPVSGFTEMLRISSYGVIFLEPHESLVGKVMGTEWERHDDAVNYVFRWDNLLVTKVVKSFFADDNYKNLSFSCWHHNPIFFKLGKIIGKKGVGLFKMIMDILFSRFGNQFCCIILKG